MKTVKIALTLAVLLGWLVSTSRATEVFVSIPPQKWLVEAVGGENVPVEVLVRAGQDPHTFEPLPRQVAALSRATIWYVMGLEFEKQLLPKVQAVAPQLEIVDMSRDVAKITMSETDHGHEDAEHGHEAAEHGTENADHDVDGGHDHEAEVVDPHVWLSPLNLQVMIRTVAETLVAADPDNAASYGQRQRTADAGLAELHQQLHEMLAPYAGSSFFVFHPSFGYFAQAYGLVQEPVEVQGKSPSPRQLAALVAKAKEKQVKIIFAQPQFDPKSAQAVAMAIGGRVVPLDALALDIPANLRLMASQIRDALQ